MRQSVSHNATIGSKPLATICSQKADTNVSARDSSVVGKQPVRWSFSPYSIRR